MTRDEIIREVVDAAVAFTNDAMSVSPDELDEVTVVAVETTHWQRLSEAIKAYMQAEDDG